jgi:predicted enzyme related to lactoylglutathione lyase
MSARIGQIDFIEFPGADAATLQRVKAFYGKAFDWEFQDWGGTYVDTASSGLGAGFNADAAQAPRQPLPVIFAVDLEKALAAVQAAGAHQQGDFSLPWRAAFPLS